MSRRVAPMQRSHASRGTLRPPGSYYVSKGVTRPGIRETPIVKVYAQASDLETVTMEYELPSIVVEDLSMDTNNESSVLYSGRASLGRRSLLAVSDTPQRPGRLKPDTGGSPALLWLDDKTLTTTPHKELDALKPIFSTPLEQYPKSPPIGFTQSASAKSLASLIEGLQTVEPSPLVKLLPDDPPRVKEEAALFSVRADCSLGPQPSTFPDESFCADAFRIKSTGPDEARRLRKCGGSQNLRDLYTRNISTGMKNPDIPITTNPAYSFEYQLTLAILDAMESSPRRRQSAGGQDTDKKPKHLTIACPLGLGGLRRRLGSPASTLTRV